MPTRLHKDEFPINRSFCGFFFFFWSSLFGGEDEGGQVTLLVKAHFIIITLCFHMKIEYEWIELRANPGNSPLMSFLFLKFSRPYKSHSESAMLLVLA